MEPAPGQCPWHYRNWAAVLKTAENNLVSQGILSVNTVRIRVGYTQKSAQCKYSDILTYIHTYIHIYIHTFCADFKEELALNFCCCHGLPTASSDAPSVKRTSIHPWNYMNIRVCRQGTPWPALKDRLEDFWNCLTFPVLSHLGLPFFLFVFINVLFRVLWLRVWRFLDSG